MYSTCTYNLHVCTFYSTSMNMQAHIRTCTCVPVQYTHVHVHVHVHVYLYNTPMYMYMYIHVCIYMYMYMYMYVHIHVSTCMYNHQHNIFLYCPDVLPDLMFTNPLCMVSLLPPLLSSAPSLTPSHFQGNCPAQHCRVIPPPCCHGNRGGGQWEDPGRCTGSGQSCGSAAEGCMTRREGGALANRSRVSSTPPPSLLLYSSFFTLSASHPHLHPAALSLLSLLPSLSAFLSAFLPLSFSFSLTPSFPSSLSPLPPFPSLSPSLPLPLSLPPPSFLSSSGGGRDVEVSCSHLHPS